MITSKKQEAWLRRFQENKWERILTINPLKGVHLWPSQQISASYKKQTCLLYRNNVNFYRTQNDIFITVCSRISRRGINFQMNFLKTRQDTDFTFEYLEKRVTRTSDSKNIEIILLCSVIDVFPILAKNIRLSSI